MTQTAIVVGAGVVGLSISLILQASGRQVTLLAPPAGTPPASWGNAGHLAVEQVEPMPSAATLMSAHSRLFSRGGALALPPASIGDWLPFALRFTRASTPARFAAGKAVLAPLLAGAVPAWRRVAGLAGAESLIRMDGHYIAWESANGARKGRKAWSQADVGTTIFRDATADEVAMVASLAKVGLSGVGRFEGSGHIADVGSLLNALRDSFVAHGGTIRIGTANKIAKAEGGGVAVHDDAGVIEAQRGIVCAGARSGDLLRPLGHTVPIIDERGYHIEAPVTEEQWPSHMPPLVFEERSMIVTRFAGKLRAASFVEFSSPGKPADSAKWERLHRHCAELGLPIGDDASRWFGSRPTLPDYLPAIGASNRLPGLFYAFGHQHLGLTLGAHTAEIMRDLMDGAAPSPALSLSRF